VEVDAVEAREEAPALPLVDPPAPFPVTGIAALFPTSMAIIDEPSVATCAGKFRASRG